ncbi:MAG: putative sulfate exporter family transporter, partial [Brachybacterium sp.]
MSLSTLSAPPVPRLSPWPGVVLALVVAAASILVSRMLPGISALVIAIAAGILAANLTTLPRSLTPG